MGRHASSDSAGPPIGRMPNVRGAFGSTSPWARPAAAEGPAERTQRAHATIHAHARPLAALLTPAHIAPASRGWYVASRPGAVRRRAPPTGCAHVAHGRSRPGES